MPTSEIHDAEGNYAGYAKFDNGGNFQGTRGGYGRGRNQGNRNNGASRVQNNIINAGARQQRRRNLAFRGI